MSNIVLDKGTFFRRIKKIYSEWKVRSEGPWKSAAGGGVIT